MGTKCFHDITIIESQQVTNKEKKPMESPIELDVNLEQKESLRQKLSHSQRQSSSWRWPAHLVYSPGTKQRLRHQARPHPQI